MLSCEQCGTSLLEAANFCGSCGHRVVKFTDPAPEADILLKQALVVTNLQFSGKLYGNGRRFGGKVIAFSREAGVGIIAVPVIGTVCFNIDACSWSRCDREMKVGLQVDFLIEANQEGLRALNVQPVPPRRGAVTK